jgi:glycosyltransferase involved in cell wall biosynthesis
METFSVVIPWRNEPKLRETLAANAGIFERHAADVLIVNCGGDPDAMLELLRGHAVSRLRQIHLPGTEFNPPLAKNIGTLYSVGRNVLFLDADVVMISDLLEEAHRAQVQRPCFVQVRTVYESQPAINPLFAYLKEAIYTQRLLLDDGRLVRLSTRVGGDGSQCGPGLLAIGRRHLLDVGGFNSALGDRGWDEFDVQIRLQIVTNLRLATRGEVLRLIDGSARNAAVWARKEGRRRNQLACAEAYSRGLFQGTYDEDVRVWRGRAREIPAASDAVAEGAS